MRHAQADNNHLDNSTRPLTELGRSIQREVSVEIQHKGYCPDLILASPLLRAQQSAEILAASCQRSVETEALLASDFDFTQLLTILAAYEHARLCCVGHMPTLAYFAQELAGREILPAGMRPSQAVILEFESEPALGRAKLVDVIGS